jgi:WD40 repeat protein
MFRWLSVCLLLAGGAYGLIAFLTGKLPGYPTTPTTTPVAARGKDNVKPPETDPQTPSTERTEPVTPREDPLPPVDMVGGATMLPRPVVIRDGTILMRQQQEVPSEREGKIVFIGVEIKPGEEVPPEKVIETYRYYLAVLCKQGEAGEALFPERPDLLYREWKPEDVPQAGEVAVARKKLRIRAIQDGETVEKGQLLAMINPEVALADVHVQVAELLVARQEYLTGGQAESTAQERYDSYLKQSRSLSKDDILRARAELEKAQGDAKKAKSAIGSAQAKLIKAAVTLKQHEVHAKIPGVVKHVYKNVQGDAVKPFESLVQLQNPKLLWVESVLDVQDALKLQPGLDAVVEPTKPEAPRLVLSGHLEPITCVAVSKGPKSVIVSGSEDKTLQGWDLISGAPLWRQSLWTVPRALACTGPSAKANLFLVGDSSGVAHIFDLDKMNAEEGPRELKERHAGGILSAAFSPDGTLCATGGEDRAVCVWDTASGKRLHRITAHRGSVTTVQFPGADRLITAGQDRRLLVWKISPTDPPIQETEFDGRSDDVGQLSASPDGKSILLDQGREIKVLTVNRKQLEGTLVNPSGSLNFSTMALFSPDGRTILTNGNAAGRLQLWRGPPLRDGKGTKNDDIPPHLARASELRQLVWNTGAVTCGAFAPDDTAVTAVTGTQDHQVLVWPTLQTKEVKPILGRLVLVERSLDTRSRQVRIRTELEDKEGILIPGISANVVVMPPAPLPIR